MCSTTCANKCASAATATETCQCTKCACKDCTCDNKSCGC